MTEASQVRARLRRHLSPYLRLIALSEGHAITEKGLPDHYWRSRLHDMSGWIESKLIPANGNPPTHFTLDQLMWGEDEVAAGGQWHLFGLVMSKPARWVLYDAPGARLWFDHVSNDPLIAISGRFPTKEILSCITGRRPYCL
jgi:hypothetical protein